jgi:hypothetical protein
MWPKEIPPKNNHFSKFGDFFFTKTGNIPFYFIFPHFGTWNRIVAMIFQI